MTRGRKPYTIRRVALHVYIPEDVLAAVKLQRYSEAQGRVPHGDMSELVTDLMREWLKREGVQG